MSSGLLSKLLLRVHQTPQLHQKRMAEPVHHLQTGPFPHIKAKYLCACHRTIRLFVCFRGLFVVFVFGTQNQTTQTAHLTVRKISLYTGVKYMKKDTLQNKRSSSSYHKKSMLFSSVPKTSNLKTF